MIYSLGSSVSVLISVLVGALLAGCASQERWVKNGATQDDFYRDSYQCQTEAARIYPAAPADSQPISTGRYAVLNMAPVASASNRAQAARACLLARGWRPVS